MRNNIFVATDDCFDDINTIISSAQNSADYIEDQSSTLFPFQLSNINVLAGAIHRYSIVESGLSSLYYHFNINDKEEINFGLRLMGSMLPTVGFTQEIKFVLDVGDRMFLVTPRDVSQTYQYYIEKYKESQNILVRRNIALRRRMFGLNNIEDTLTENEITTAIDAAFNVSDALFSTFEASNERYDFDTSFYINGVPDTNGTSKYVCRYLTIKEEE